MKYRARQKFLAWVVAGSTIPALLFACTGEKAGTSGASMDGTGGTSATTGEPPSTSTADDTTGESGEVTTTSGNETSSTVATGGQSGSGGETATGGESATGGETGSGGGTTAPGLDPLPDAGTEGDGNYEVGPDYERQPELGDLGAPKGQRFEFSMALADSKIFDGQDSTLDPDKPVNSERSIVVYVPARYQDGTPAPLLVIQDGPGEIGMVQNALDNLTISEDPARKLPPFVAIAVQNGGNDAQGSERGLEYDTMSDRYARFINEEVLAAVVSDPKVHAAYPNLKFTTNPSGRAALGCSSGGVAGVTMGWFRPDLFARIIAYSTTLVDQQDYDAPERDMYPNGAWDYHSGIELIANAEVKPLRIFMNVNENDLRANDDESTHHNWVMANDRTAAALAEKHYHYRYVLGLGAGHCDGGVRGATLADALIWVWRGYKPTAE